jgi:hypothetical protein
MARGAGHPPASSSPLGLDHLIWTVESSWRLVTRVLGLGQLTVERVMFAPLIDLRLLVGVGFRVAAHGLNVLPLSPFPAPEVMRLKAP